MYSPTPGSLDTNSPLDVRTRRCVYVSAISRTVRVVEHRASDTNETFRKFDQQCCYEVGHQLMQNIL